MKKIGVTTAKDFTDLDGLACAIAYTELLILEGKEAEAVLPGQLNASVTDEIKSWDYEYKKTPSPNTQEFVLVDTTHDLVIPDFAKDKIIEIYDHHMWDRDFWRQRIGERAVIEEVGAAATLIWEEFVKRKEQDSITQTSARLLFCAIISNSLNFTVPITSSRDKKAFEELSEKVDLPKDWTKKYFEDTERDVWKNPKKSILNDTKKPYYYESLGKEITIGQVELWDSKRFVLENKKLIEDTMEGLGTKFWVFNAPSISEEKSYIITKSEYMKEFISKYFDVKFDGNFGETKNLVGRKDYMEKILNL